MAIFLVEIDLNHSNCIHYLLEKWIGFTIWLIFLINSLKEIKILPEL